MKTQNPRVTVGLPVYNGERFLREAIDSILAQSLTDFTLIISDNASTDGTQAICEYYARTDDRVRYVRHGRNHGAAWNFNEVFRRATTPFFMWHASDDVACPTYLEVCVSSLELRPESILAYTEAVPIDACGRALRYESKILGLENECVAERFRACLGTVPYSENAIYGVARTSAVGRTRLLGGFGGSDRAFLAELSLYGSFVRVNERLFRRRRCDPTVAESEIQIQRYNSGREDRFSLREWRILCWILRSVRRAPPFPEGKLRLYGELLHKVICERSIYIWELKQVLKSLAVRGFGRKLI